MPADTIPARLFRNAKVRPYKPAYYIKTQYGWRPTSWATYAGEVRQAARALLAMGLGEGGTVGILGFNRPEWCIADLACMCAGGAPAGIYTTCSPPEVQYILHHAESPVVFVENLAQLAKVQEKWDELPHLKFAVTMKGTEPVDDDRVLTWDEFNARGDDIPAGDVDRTIDELEPDGLATLIYTSGTTGPPKGVMLSHDNLAWTSNALSRAGNGNEEDVSLSYLPLSHIAEQTASIHMPITAGASVYFAESIDKVADNLKDARPTIMFGVPRIWEKFHAGVSAKLKQATGVKAELVKWARGVGSRYNAEKNAGREPGKRLTVQYRLADKLIFSKLKAALGLDRGRNFISGAAPIGKEVLEFFASLDIVVQEIYGQSEDCGPTSFNMPGRTRFGSVGQPLDGVEVKIAEDGEICVRGRNVFLGYYKDEAATNDTLIDGWMHSGDLGELDAEGFLTITGRKKDIIITSGGKNIAPKNLEATLKNSDLINEAVIIGDQRKYLTALVTLDEEAVVASGKANGGAPHESSAIRAEIQSVVDEMNKHLAQVETVKKFTILSRNFSVEDGELTPTLKVKRKIVNEHFADEIEAMYAD